MTSTDTSHAIIILKNIFIFNRGGGVNLYSFYTVYLYTIKSYRVSTVGTLALLQIWTVHLVYSQQFVLIEKQQTTLGFFLALIIFFFEIFFFFFFVLIFCVYICRNCGEYYIILNISQFLMLAFHFMVNTVSSDNHMSYVYYYIFPLLYKMF